MANPPSCGSFAPLLRNNNISSQLLLYSSVCLENLLQRCVLVVLCKIHQYFSNAVKRLPHKNFSPRPWNCYIMLLVALRYNTMLILNMISIGPYIVSTGALSSKTRNDIVILLVVFLGLSIYDFCCLRTFASTLVPVSNGLIARKGG